MLVMSIPVPKRKKAVYSVHKLEYRLASKRINGIYTYGSMQDSECALSFVFVIPSYKLPKLYYTERTNVEKAIKSPIVTFIPTLFVKSITTLAQHSFVFGNNAKMNWHPYIITAVSVAPI